MYKCIWSSSDIRYQWVISFIPKSSAKSAILIYDTFDNNLEIQNDFTE